MFRKLHLRQQFVFRSRIYHVRVKYVVGRYQNTVKQLFRVQYNYRTLSCFVRISYQQYVTFLSSHCCAFPEQNAASILNDATSGRPDGFHCLRWLLLLHFRKEKGTHIILSEVAYCACPSGSQILIR